MFTCVQVLCSCGGALCTLLILDDLYRAPQFHGQNREKRIAGTDRSWNRGLAILHKASNVRAETTGS